MALGVDQLRELMTPEGMSDAFAVLGADLASRFNMRSATTGRSSVSRLTTSIGAELEVWAQRLEPELRSTAGPLVAVVVDHLDSAYQVDATNRITDVAAVAALATRGVVGHTRQVAGDVASRWAKTVDALTTSTDATPEEVDGYLRGRLDTYATTIAAAFLARARSAALVGGMAAGGVQQLRYVAVMDANTSEICEYMNGRVMEVDAALDLLDRVAAVNEQAVFNTYPWARRRGNQLVASTASGDVVVAEMSAASGERVVFRDGLTTTELQRLGIILPPLHFRCRSSVEPV